MAAFGADDSDDEKYAEADDAERKRDSSELGAEIFFAVGPMS